MTGATARWHGDAVRPCFVVASPYGRVMSVPEHPSTDPAAGGGRVGGHGWGEWITDRRAERDRQAMLGLLDEITGVADPIDRVHRLLQRLGELLEADVCRFEQVEFAPARRMTLSWPGAAVPIRAEPAAAAAPAPGGGSLAEYRRLFASLPTAHQLAIPLRLDGTAVIGCTAGRAVRPFTDREQGLATTLQLALAPLRPSLPEAGAGPEPAAGPPPARNLLTPREHEILAQLASGLTAKAISRALGVSPRTVGKHLENLYAKLGVNDRLSAVTQAQSLGLIPLPTRRTSAAPARPTAPAAGSAAVPAAATAGATVTPLAGAHREAYRQFPPPPRIIPAGC